MGALVAVAPRADAPARRVVRQVVRAVRTTPGRLAATGAALVVLALLAGAFAFAAVREREDAAKRIATRSEPLVVRTQEIYRALADADATAAASLLSSGVEKPELRDRYEASMKSAESTLVDAAAAGETGPVAGLLRELAVQVPLYRDDVAHAKAERRQGHPLGAAYLRTASRQMEEQILPAADQLHKLAEQRLRADHSKATAVPQISVAVGLFALGALVVAQVLLTRRTKRVLNPALLVASVAVLASTVWLVYGLSSARDDLARSRDDGWQPVAAMSAARFSVLQARADESQILIQHGADNGAYDKQFEGQLNALTAKTPDGLLSVAAARSSADSVTGPKVAAAVAAVEQWRAAHSKVMEDYDKTSYTSAVDQVVKDDGPSLLAFKQAEQALADATAKDQGDFERAVHGGRDALSGLGVGVVVLALVAAAGVVDGVRRRLKEYR
ncbi:hypothetical protein [Yinghuangia seranimata]|uniref:hypothetical protein n=1 Tax=Yinghuangia seranimata TaxID=408067 RepID=UPI00248AC3C5|nr:hypothetical protein [Yinghuangia seranimata]MDI2125190.1 hypothetical protein [Yinghuangia seranimata]